MIFSDQVDNVTPEKYASTLSRIVFSWMDSLAYKGWKTKLDPEMLWALEMQNRQYCIFFLWHTCFELHYM